MQQFTEGAIKMTTDTINIIKLNIIKKMNNAQMDLN